MTAKECKRFFEKITTNAFLWQKVISMFNIRGLPPYVNERILKSWLFASGMLAVWFEDDFFHYGVAQYGGGKVLEDGTNSKVLISTAVTAVERDVADTGIIWLNSVRCPLVETVERYGRFMREGDISLLSALYNIRSMKMPIASTDSQRKQWEEVFKAQERGQRAVPVVPLIDLMEHGNVVADLSQGTPNTLKDIMDYRQRIVAEFDNQLGIGVFDGLKRERMITDELNNINASSRFNVQDMFDTISAGLEDCNNKLGTDWHLEYSDVYNVVNVDNVSRETIEEEEVIE